MAIRTLSALGVPTRYTYITFDQLMTPAELRSTHAFQARRDLILKPLPHLPVPEIIDGVRDEAFVEQHSAGQPFYEQISYMLVGAGEQACGQHAGHGHLPGQRPVIGMPVRRLRQRPADHAVGQQLFQQARPVQFLQPLQPQARPGQHPSRQARA